jgi:hypothetical protein
VAVGPHEVVSHPVDAEAGERRPVDVVQDAGSGFAGQAMRRHEACIAVAKGRYVVAVPVDRRPAEKEVEGRRGNRFVQPGMFSIAGYVGIGKAVSGIRAAAHRRLPLLDRRAASVADTQLRERSERESAAVRQAERERCEPRRHVRSSQPDERAR